MKKHSYVLTLGLTIAISAGVFGGLGYLIGGANGQAEVTSHTRQTLAALQKDLGVEAEIIENSEDEWKIGESSYIPLIGDSFSIAVECKTAPSTCRSTSKYDDLTTDDISQPILDEVRETARRTLIGLGFKKDVLSSKPLVDFMYGVDAYVKNDQKCLVQTGTSNPFAFIFCGEHDQVQSRLQKNISSLYKSDDEASIWVEKISGRFAIGRMHGREGGGSMWIALKNNGSWQEIFTGQDSPRCEIIDEYKVPREIMENCIELNGETRY